MSQNQPIQSSKGVECKALDAFGCLGCLYDKREDRILKGWNETTIKGSSRLLRSSLCKLTDANMDNNFNLLEFIDIEDELRLNLLLKTRKRVGIASVMNYSRPIDEWTRMLYYSYIDRQEQVISIDAVSKMLESVDHQRFATHVITTINFGIDLVVILQLPSEVDIITRIDSVLKKIRTILVSNDSTISILTSDENGLLERNISITVYSNVSTFTTLTRISDILYYVNRMKSELNFPHPITYYLYPTIQLHSQYKATVRNISPTLIKKVERHLLQLRTSIQYLEVSFKGHTSKSFYGFLQDQFYRATRQWSNLKDSYVKETQRFSDIMTGVRSGRYDGSTVDSALQDNAFTTLKTSINQLIQDLCGSEEQRPSIIQSQQQPFHNYNLVEQHLYENNSPRTTDTMLDNKTDSKGEDFSQVFVDEDRSNSNLYPVAQLQDMKSPLDDIKYDENQSREETPLPTDISLTPALPEPPSPPPDSIINILLLGETGVGKSTFINAFVNYLSFDTFEQAELNRPVVLIPVSFLMTIGNDFEERTVKFGDIDNSKNEDFDHPGQSVTQHCKSYIFHLNDGKQLCIIDTPGFGDTRGLDQDDHNMQNILEYMNNLSHLNAICFLLKPNTSRLNVFFRLCLTQILDLLGPNICKNLTFCFTNARTTFYTPGDTAPLLKKMIESLSLKDIPFRKENTFCFDNESFRYFVALRNDISFNEEDKKEYDISWSNSVKESNRLINYIRTNLVMYPKQGEWQSIKHAQFEITYMIRPILETMRNILRNIILQNIMSQNKSIELYPVVIHRSASVCLICKQEKIQIDKFWIIQDDPHEFQNTCLHCSCSPDHHIRIDYILNYKLVNTSSNYLQNDILNRLCQASATFAYFFIHITRSMSEDRFQNGLTQMIIQENDLNSQLTKELIKLQEIYEQNINRMKSNLEQIPLTHIYDLMNSISKIPMIKIQMDVIQRGREIMMKQHENEHQEI